MTNNQSHMKHFDSINQSILNTIFHISKMLCSLENAFLHIILFKSQKSYGVCKLIKIKVIIIITFILAII